MNNTNNRLPQQGDSFRTLADRLAPHIAAFLTELAAFAAAVADDPLVPLSDYGPSCRAAGRNGEIPGVIRLGRGSKLHAKRSAVDAWLAKAKAAPRRAPAPVEVEDVESAARGALRAVAGGRR